MFSKSFQQVLNELQGKPILVANRGIPALRICRTIKERLNAIPFLTATDIDNTTFTNTLAHKIISLGSDPKAYLDIDTIIKKAKEHKVIAIHPGWGFVSENKDFPNKCLNEGIVFIGSTHKSIEILGNKVQLRNLAQRLKIPTIPGTNRLNNIEEAKNFAKNFSYPFLIKAEDGGGGKGITFVQDEKELEYAFFKASSMAQASFDSSNLYIEKYLENVHHIEIQVIADKYGNIFAFDERDCSIQRNHQKLIEITPSPWKGITHELRELLKKYSYMLIKEAAYTSLATVEFLVTPSGEAFLIEVNTRLQVEHGITECRYGIDLVEEQIAIAFGAQLRFNSTNMTPTYKAMQVRVNYEDPKKAFMPNIGTVTQYIPPSGPGIRIDSTIHAGYNIPSKYDSAGALLITYGQDWEKVFSTMSCALKKYVISGIKTTIPFCKNILEHPDFQQGNFTTTFIQSYPELFTYHDDIIESEGLAQLIAEISAYGYNPYIQLEKYRTLETPKLPQHKLVLPYISTNKNDPYPKGNRKILLDMIRDSKKIHFTDTTTRDNTQSNNGNRFRLAEDAIIGPYLDNCGFFSLETGGGAHFHVAMLANKTNPFHEARAWNTFAPKTAKQALVRSTNLLGYQPHPKNLMNFIGSMLCENFHVIRCFDFLNHIDNMVPFAKVVLDHQDIVFEPTIALSWTDKFTIQHYLNIADAILIMVSQVTGLTQTEASRIIILGLKDMAGACPPRFITNLVQCLRKKWPELVLHYHRHSTDGLFIPTVGAAAKAGVNIIDTTLDIAARSYGQGAILSTIAYIEDELQLETQANITEIRNANFVLKQIIPYYDRYCTPYVQGIDYDVVHHGMPGGATSSSQESIFKQGYIHLLPQILTYLSGTRKIVHYHDVTPGSQITWNTAFLAITNAYKRGGGTAVNHLLNILDKVTNINEENFSEDLKTDALLIYQDCNDAFRNLILGKFGKLPLGFPPNWVYKSAFGNEWENAIKNRTEHSPLNNLVEVDFETKTQELKTYIQREPTKEELAMYLSHPSDAIKTIQFQTKYGDPNNIPLHVWFEGAEPGVCINFSDSQDTTHQFQIINSTYSDKTNTSTVNYTLDASFFTYNVQHDSNTVKKESIAMANTLDPLQIAAPANGDLWAVYVKPGDVVKKGDELFNISIMKQEKAITSPVNGTVKNVLKTVNYKETKEMLPVFEGELIVELEDSL